MSDERWFEVAAVVKVRAPTEDEAVDRVSEALTDAKIPGLFPVGEFSSGPTDDPIERARQRLSP